MIKIILFEFDLRTNWSPTRTGSEFDLRLFRGDEIESDRFRLFHGPEWKNHFFERIRKTNKVSTACYLPASMEVSAELPGNIYKYGINGSQIGTGHDRYFPVASSSTL